MGLSIRKRKSPASKGKSYGQGGIIKKKTRAAFDLGGVSIKDSEAGLGHTTDAARKAQEKVEK